MAFMLKRKKYYKFQVEISVEELTAVPFINVVLFAKVRLLNGGSFVDTSSRKEVCDNAVKWAAKFGFVCKMTANAATGILNPCVLRVSVRKEIKGGRSFQKLGFCDLNLAEFAGSGETSRRYLLEGYGTRQRQDNSMLTVSIKMNLLSGDILFKVPSPSSNHRPISEQEDDAECGVNYSNSSAGRMVSNGNNTANNSLPKKRSTLFSSDLVNCTDDSVRISEKQEDILRNGGVCENCLSREPQNSVTFGNLNNSPNHSNADSHFQHRLHHSPKDYRHVRNSSLNTYSDGTGSINQTKTSHECKKKVDGGSQDHSASGIDTDSLIEELIRSTIHNHPIESDDNLGLQLFIAKDGTTTLGTPRTQSRLSAGGFKEVVVKSTPT